MPYRTAEKPRPKHRIRHEKPASSKSEKAASPRPKVIPIKPQIIRMDRPPSGMRRKGVGVSIGAEEIRTLIQLIEFDGIDGTAKAMGVCSHTLLMVTSGLLHRCTYESQRRVRIFFGADVHEVE